MQNEIQIVYKKIQRLIVKLIPEKWKSIYLYASTINGKNGEMYFYYFPKKLIKTKPVNCYEVPARFGLDEEAYNKELKKLYTHILELNKLMISKWTNLTISMENDTFTIEYHFNNLTNSKYSDEERRTVWSYKYLQIPIESMGLKDRLLIESYKEDEKMPARIHSEKISDTLYNNINSEENDDDKTVKNPILKC